MGDVGARLEQAVVADPRFLFFACSAADRYEFAEYGAVADDDVAFSPLNFKSCGSEPMDALGKNRQFLPIFVQPSIVT